MLPVPSAQLRSRTTVVSVALAVGAAVAPTVAARLRAASAPIRSLFIVLSSHFRLSGDHGTRRLQGAEWPLAGRRKSACSSGLAGVTVNQSDRLEGERGVSGPRTAGGFAERSTASARRRPTARGAWDPAPAREPDRFGRRPRRRTLGRAAARVGRRHGAGVRLAPAQAALERRGANHPLQAARLRPASRSRASGLASLRAPYAGGDTGAGEG